jgi:hypothetical protein
MLPVNKIFYFWIIAVCWGLSILTACTSSAEPAALTHLEITLDEQGCHPAQWRLPAGEEVSLAINNHSGQPSQLVILSDPLYIPFERSRPPQVYFEANFAPQERRTLRFTAPAAAGEYDLICGQFPEPAPDTLGKLIVERR